MKTGEILTTKIFKSQGFGRGTGATFKCKDGHIMAYLYMGTITQDSAPHFSPDGALAALGYGPIMTTITQRKLIDALRVAGTDIQHVLDGGTLPDAEITLKQVDAALIASQNFGDAAVPLVDPILLNAARFDALLNLLERRIASDLMLHQVLTVGEFDIPGIGEPIPGMREKMIAVIDAATRK